MQMCEKFLYEIFDENPNLKNALDRTSSLL